MIKEYALDINEYANEVRITERIERFDPASRWAPTPEEYEAGSREAYTANSVRAFNRHCRTNYDALIDGLDRDDALERAVYNAVRERVDLLLDEAEYESADEVDDDDNEGDLNEDA